MTQPQALHWDLIIRAKGADQASKIVNWLVADGHITFDFEPPQHSGMDDDVYEITIHDHCWGANLENLAKFLNTLDEWTWPATPL